jgi:MFS family permease
VALHFLIAADISLASPQGAAPTAIPSMVFADMFSLAERTLWQQVLNLVWAIGSIVGPILGGLLVTDGRNGWVIISSLLKRIIYLLLIRQYRKIPYG